MSTPTVEHIATLWMANDIPARMIYAGRRWRVTDHPHATTTLHLDRPPSTNHTTASTDGDSKEPTTTGISLVFDAYKGEDGWHVHRTYD